MFVHVVARVVYKISKMCELMGDDYRETKINSELRDLHIFNTS